jgi:hypothetical protein
MKTWKERIMEATSGRNPQGRFLWYSHSKIIDCMDELEGGSIRGEFCSITPYLSDLVKHGYMIRAVKPPSLLNRPLDNRRPEYLYRQTGKPFKRGIVELSSRKNAHTNAQATSRQSHDLWREHRKLPYWFRRLMYD